MFKVQMSIPIPMMVMWPLLWPLFITSERRKICFIKSSFKVCTPKPRKIFLNKPRSHEVSLIFGGMSFHFLFWCDNTAEFLRLESGCASLSSIRDDELSGIFSQKSTELTINKGEIRQEFLRQNAAY